jgi:hypothetical protein
MMLHRGEVLYHSDAEGKAKTKKSLIKEEYDVHASEKIQKQRRQKRTDPEIKKLFFLQGLKSDPQ